MTNNKQVSSNIKFWNLVTDEFFQGILSCLVIDDPLLQEIVKILEEVLVSLLKYFHSLVHSISARNVVGFCHWFFLIDPP